MIAHPLLRRVGRGGIAVLLVVAVLLALHQLAAAITARHLSARTADTAARIEAGVPLWQWTLHRPRDVIAGRAFGHARIAAGPAGGLRITSDDGTPFELGLPIATALDLAHWPILVLHLEGPPRTQLSVVWQGSDGSACLGAAAEPLVAPVSRIDLRSLSWQSARGGSCQLPTSARMLRLRLTLPAHATLLLTGAALEAPSEAHLAELDLRRSALRLPEDPVERNAVLALIDRSPVAAPLLRLPATASAEQMLRARDAVAAIRPGALLLAGSAALTPARHEPMRGGWGWAAALAYMALLGGLAARRRHGWPELVACMLGPLWLMAGLQWGLRMSPPGALAFASSLLFAAVLQWRDAPPGWHWVGDWRKPAWWLPMILLPAAIVLAWGFGHAIAPIPLRRAAVYLGWAALQQWLILGFLMTRMERLLPRPSWVVFIASVLFALLHTPNGVLMQLCFVAELWLGVCFIRSRSLLPVAIAHAASALLVGASLVGGPLRSLEVSARFFL